MKKIILLFIILLLITGCRQKPGLTYDEYNVIMSDNKFGTTQINQELDFIKENYFSTSEDLQTFVNYVSFDTVSQTIEYRNSLIEATKKNNVDDENLKETIKKTDDYYRSNIETTSQYFVIVSNNQTAIYGLTNIANKDALDTVITNLSF